MARSGFAAFLVALCLHGSFAASMTAKESVVRREPEKVQLTSHGELMQEGKREKTQAAKDADVADPPALQCNTDPQKTCSCEYPMGTEGAKECTGGMATMLTKSACIDAGRLAGANVDHEHFLVPQRTNDRWEYKHPKGCYMDHCGAGISDKICYYYNEVDNQEDYTYPVTGTSVCTRPMHAYGATDAQGGCPAEYSVIDDKDACLAAAGCGDIGMVTTAHFTIGMHNGSKHLDYPRGCFWIKEEGENRVYYNGPNLVGNGTNVKGTPICKVTTPVTWGADSAPSGDAEGFTKNISASL